MSSPGPLLAHAGESHRRGGGETPTPSRPAEAGGAAGLSPGTPPPVAAALAGSELLIGLVVLSGWLWLRLLRRAWPPRLSGGDADQSEK